MALTAQPETFAGAEGADRALMWPLGAASPLWAVFGAAAGMGVAWWWMTGWARHVRILALDVPEPTPPAAAAIEALAAIVEPAPIAENLAAPDQLEAVAEIEPEPARPTEEPALLDAAEPPSPPADDLTVLSGIGPKLAQALQARGVNRFAQIAAWTEDDLAEFDRALALKGRAVRDRWVAQARRLAGA